MANNFISYTSKKSGLTVNSGSLKLLLDDYQKKLDKALAGKSQSAVNSIIRVALNEAGEMWVRVFLPMRFSDYAISVLGYRATDSYNKEKVEAASAGRALDFHSARSFEGQDINSGVVIPPQPTPFVASGRSKELCLSTARVEVRATATTGRILIRCQVGVIKFPKQYEAFKSIPAIERKRVIDQVKSTLDHILGFTGPNNVYDSSFRFTEGRKMDFKEGRAM
jgi:hypothetical protein